MKKNVVLGIVSLIIFSGLGNVFADDNTGNFINQTDSQSVYSEEEIEAFGIERLNELNKASVINPNVIDVSSLNNKISFSDDIKPLSSFYNEYFDGYEAEYVTSIPDAFKVHSTSVDNSDGNYTTTGYDVTFNVVTTVTGTHNFSASVSGNYTINAAVIKKGVEVKAGYSFEESKSTQDAVGTTFYIRNLNEKKLYYVEFFSSWRSYNRGSSV